MVSATIHLVRGGREGRRQGPHGGFLWCSTPGWHVISLADGTGGSTFSPSSACVWRAWCRPRVARGAACWLSHLVTFPVCARVSSCAAGQPRLGLPDRRLRGAGLPSRRLRPRPDHPRHGTRAGPLPARRRRQGLQLPGAVHRPAGGWVGGCRLGAPFPAACCLVGAPVPAAAAADADAAFLWSPRLLPCLPRSLSCPPAPCRSPPPWNIPLSMPPPIPLLSSPAALPTIPSAPMHPASRSLRPWRSPSPCRPTCRCWRAAWPRSRASLWWGTPTTRWSARCASSHRASLQAFRSDSTTGSTGSTGTGTALP